MAQPHPEAAEAAKYTLFDAALIVLAGVVVIAAGRLSFDSLQALGSRVGWNGREWLLPLCIDVQAAVGTLGWVHPTIAADTRATARNMTITAVVLSASGNAVEHLITAWTRGDAWWEIGLAVIVGALPVLAMALTLHLVSQLLVNRSQAKTDVAKAEREAEEQERKPRTKGRARRTTPPPVTPPAPPVDPDAEQPTPPAAPDVDAPPTGDAPANPFLIRDPDVAAGVKTIGERLNLLIDHLTRHGVSIHELSGKVLADHLQDFYGIDCSEQRGRQVLSPRKHAATAADRSPDEATTPS